MKITITWSNKDRAHEDGESIVKLLLPGLRKLLSVFFSKCFFVIFWIEILKVKKKCIFT